MDMLPLMAGEDFSYMLNERPGAYIFVGNGGTAGPFAGIRFRRQCDSGGRKLVCRHGRGADAGFRLSAGPAAAPVWVFEKR